MARGKAAIWHTKLSWRCWDNWSAASATALHSLKCRFVLIYPFQRTWVQIPDMIWTQRTGVSSGAVLQDVPPGLQMTPSVCALVSLSVKERKFSQLRGLSDIIPVNYEKPVTPWVTVIQVTTFESPFRLWAFDYLWNMCNSCCYIQCIYSSDDDI